MRLIFLFLLLFSVSAYSGETVLEVEQNSPDLKKAVQTAIQKVSVELMEQFIEPSKLKAKKRQIRKIISAYSNRYILYTRTAPPIEKKPHSFIISVTIGFSEENLKKILLEEDLFYSGTSHLRILPMVLFEDLVERENYGWWIKKEFKPDISMRMRSFYNQIQSVLMSYGFFIINPEMAGSRHFIPYTLSFKKPKKKNIFNLARFFQCNLVMTGSVKIRESDIRSVLSVKGELTVYHVDSGRLLAEVEQFAKIQMDEKKSDPIMSFLKQYENFAKGLGVQLQSIYEAGQMAANLLRITVKGKMSYRSSHQFRKLLNSEVKSIKDLKENVISTGSITYIANANASAKVVSKKIKGILFPGFYVRVSRVGKKEIVLQVRPKN